MALKKSELYSSLWQSCDELRGGMDASQYKDYVLVLLFVKYISDKYVGQPYAPVVVPEGASFRDMVALKGKASIGDDINKKILAPLARHNQLSDMPDFNDATKLGTGREMVDRLTNLIAIFEDPRLDFSRNRADGDDILGDAYEYLMRHFATESGKSKGQFYTPAEVSRVMAKILGIGTAQTTSSTTVYDPTCGSGSLLIKVADEARSDVTLYGQEKDAATSGLARMNMFLHDQASAAIHQGNTLTSPHFLEPGGQLKTFDYVVANPPFSDKRWSNGLDPANDPYGRFRDFGIPPDKQGDFAYLLHILRSLKSTGKGACILPHGVLFRGNAEGTIRKNLIQRGYIRGIIGLPPNLFYGTGIPACIVVLDKQFAHARRAIFMMDASRGFRKDGPKNRLREQDIHRIVDTFTREVEVPGYSRLVPLAEIADPRNDYNLNLPRYIDTTEAEDLQDITAHLRGGIPERDLDGLARYWEVLPGLRQALFETAAHAGCSRLKVELGQLKTEILSHGEFERFRSRCGELLSRWRSSVLPVLRGFDRENPPRLLIERISEELLATFRGAPLLDPYDVYQHLMDYWAEAMQDDAYLIAADGWTEAAQPQLLMEQWRNAGKVKADLVVSKKKYQAQLIPPALLIARYFAAEQAAVDALEAQVAGLKQELEELVEEHGGEGGVLDDLRNDKGKFTTVAVAKRLRELRAEKDAGEEREVLQRYLKLTGEEAEVSTRLKEAQEELMVALLARYRQLSEEEIKALVVEAKWLQRIEGAVQGEMERVSQALTGRIRELAERYARPLPELEREVEALSNRVEGHLARMGVVWR